MREREIETREVIIRFNKSKDLPEESMEKDHEDAMNVVTSRPDVFTGNVRTHWRQLLIELSQLRTKVALDPFVFWLQQPDQEALLDRVHDINPMTTTPTIIATVGSGENFEDLFEQIKKGPGVSKVSPNWQIGLIEPKKD